MSAVNSFIARAVSLAHIWEHNSQQLGIIFAADNYSICSETRFCKLVFTEAGVFLQNKSSTAVSIKT